MRLRIGYELQYHFPQATPVIMMLNVHYTRVSDLETTGPHCHRPLRADLRLPGRFRKLVQPDLGPRRSDAHLDRHGRERHRAARSNGCRTLRRVPVEELPEDALVFLIASRYCDSDRLLDLAWTLFGQTNPGWARVQAICDFVHERIAFGYEHARVTRSASEAYEEKRGVCRDYAHLAIAFCRALNIPARYCTGYLGDVGTPPPYPPGDFAAWFEAYLGGQWHTFDPRNNVPRIGRVLLARGRDAADVAITTTFGPNTLNSFRVWTDEVTA